MFHIIIMQHCGPNFFFFLYVCMSQCVRVYDFRSLLMAAIPVEEMAETYIQRGREREKERQRKRDRQTDRQRETTVI